MNTPFTIHTSFFCQWTSGAKEYFPTVEQAIEKAAEMYVRKSTMTDENFKYWLAQKQIIGIETVITQELDIVSAP